MTLNWNLCQWRRKRILLDLKTVTGWKVLRWFEVDPGVRTDLMAV